MLDPSRPPRQIDLASLTRFGFLTLPGFSLIALTTALEALRMANYVARQEIYSWAVVTVDGTPAAASSGLTLAPTCALDAARPLDVLFVCGGIDVRRAVDRRLADALRRVERGGIMLGGICTGAYALAAADLMNGYRCSIHWENLASIREAFPEVTFVEDLFVFDRDRFTCSGGVAPLDMMAGFIEARLGREGVGRVMNQFVVDRVRRSTDPQHPPLKNRISAGHPVLDRAAQMMIRTIETPLPMPAIAQRAGVSTRQLERLFKSHLGIAPAEFYLTVRLDRARELLRLSDLSVTDVGIACGFQSAAHFSSAYSRRFRYPPKAERVG